MTILTIRTVKIHADHHPQLFLLKRRQGIRLILQIHVLKVLAHKMDHVLKGVVRLRVGIHLDSVLRVKVKAIDHPFHVPVTIVIMVLGLVHQVADGVAADAGVRPGDIIQKLNGQSVKDSKEFIALARKLPVDKAVPMVILRQGQPKIVAIRLEGKEQDKKKR